MHAKMKLIYMPRAFSRSLIKSVRPDKPDMSFEEFIQPLESQASPELIPCPREFDFTDEDWNHRSNVFYVEPMILRTALGSPTGPAPAPLPIQAGTPLIFATSGSQVQDYEARAREFFKNLIAMMQTQGMGSYHLVAAVGSKLLLELTEEYSGTNSLPSNITLLDWVSQLDIFGNTDLRAVYMHGGLATIKEAIWKKVPIVIVPHGKDQLDNSLRLGRKGLGVVAQQDGLSPLNLRKLLTAATTSTWIKNSLTTMQGIMAVDEDKPAAQKPSVLKIQAVLGL
jgi:UDP:flavonoid glycosyltransferase YjiC (YdhE family)